MSSKHAAAAGNKELFFYVLGLIQKGKARSIPKKKLWYLKHRGFITPTTKGYSLLPKGVAVLAEEHIWRLSIPTQKYWDGKWRLVMFDIPKDKRKRRDIFRLRIKEMGLVLYQNSIWLYPYPLEETVSAVADFYKLSPCISYITAEKISGDKKFRQHFNI